MAAGREFHYFCEPTHSGGHDQEIAFVPITEFLADETACKRLWSLIDSQFKTRSKFLAIWRCVSFVALHRNASKDADGFLLVSSPVNWQIDYVVVHPDSRGQGIAKKLVTGTIAHAAKRNVPYVMLTSNESLRAMYESCGFRVVETES